MTLEDLRDCLPSPTSIPEDWYRHFFDRRYLAVDKMRKGDGVTQSEVDAILSLASSHAPLRILDLCCGYGRHALELARRGHDVVAIDLAADLLAHARRVARHEALPVQFLRCDVRQVPTGPFDLAICMHTSLGYVPSARDDVAAIAAVHRQLRAGGTLIIQQIDPEASYGIERSLSERFLLGDGTAYQKQSMLDMRGPRWTGVYRYDRPSGRVTALPFRIRLYTRLQYLSLLEHAGFSREGILIDEWEPTSEKEAPALQITARRAQTESRRGRCEPIAPPVSTPDRSGQRRGKWIRRRSVAAGHDLD